MARKARPWFRTGRGWCVVVNGRIVPLGVADPGDESGAWAAWDRLRKGLPGAAIDPAATVAQMVPRFLAHVAGRVKPRTVRNYSHYLSRFLAAFGREFLANLDAAGIERWAGEQPWSATNRANYLWTVGTFLRWCGSPVRLTKPRKASRGADSVIPPEVYAALLRESAGDFHQLIRFLWATGCRPSEASAAAVEHVRWDQAVVVLAEHKTSKSVPKPRLIFLVGDGLAVVREQAEKYRTGLLFRTTRGGRFTLQAYTMRFQRLSEKVGRRVCSYDFRHTYVTRALAKGTPDALVAALVGHKGTRMIDQFYSHVAADARLLRDAAERAAG